MHGVDILATCMSTLISSQCIYMISFTAMQDSQHGDVLSQPITGEYILLHQLCTTDCTIW